MKKSSWKNRTIAFLIMVSMLVVVLLPTSIGTQVFAAETLKEDEKLLYGYDVTGGKNLMEPDALQTAFPIIDPNSDYLSHVKKIEGTKQTSEAYSNSSLARVAEQFAQNISAEAFGRIYVVDADVSSSFDLTKRVDNVYSEKYELYTTSISRYYYIVQLSTEEIRGYLSSQFKSDIAAVKSKSDAVKLFEKYGTHLNTGYTFGGRMNITNYMTTSDTTADLSKGIALKEKVSAVLSKIQVGESASIVEQYSSLENDKNSTSTYKFESFGGVATSSLTLDGLFTYNASYVDGNNAGFMYTRWINSINDDQNLAIIGIPNGAKSIPLWDLLDSTAGNYNIRQYLIEAYIEICGDTYNEFMAQYPELVRVSEIVTESSGILPTFNGAYVRTKNDYYYYVDTNDFATSGSHYGVHTGEYLYLDLTMFSSVGELTYDCQNCEIVDKQSAIFKITGTSGNAIITVSCGDKKADLIKAPIKTLMCEGGMGNESYPYIVTSADHFLSIPKSNSSYYTLYSDIDFGGKTISSLGNFSGVLDGNYCKVRNFKIESSKEWGLFSKNTGTIKNLKIEDAGSSTGYADFSAGGVNYKEDKLNDAYTKNSVKSLNAGILCATNSGIIENCFLDRGYVRNVIKNDNAWFVDSKITMNTGALVGINSGTIKDCMAKNMYLLGSFVNSTENTYAVNVFTGGLAGQLIEGSVISSTIVDMGTGSVIMSQIYNAYSKDKSDATAQSYSGGIAGYSNAASSMNNVFVYVRNAAANSNYRAIDAEFTNYEKGWSLSWNAFPESNKPKTYHALKSAVMVCGSDCNLNSRDNYAYSADTSIPLSCIKPSSKNGSNSNGEKSTYSEINSVTDKNVNSQANYNTLGLTETSFSYDGSSTATSHVNHLLSQNRKNYIKLIVDKSNQTVDATVCDGAMFNPKGIEMMMEVNTEEVTAKVFRLKVVDKDSNNVTDSPLVLSDGNSYKVIPSIYGEEIKADKDIELTISDNKIVSVSVVDEADLYHIYYDERDKYVNSWNASSIKLQAVMTNGEVKLIDDLADSEVSIVTKASNIARGENVISIKFKRDGKSYDAAYILNVEERKVSSISIAAKPTTLNYAVGETVKLDGLQVDVNYEIGDSVRLSGVDLNQLEVLGESVAEGKNTITLLYGSYDYAASFEVQGEKKAATGSSVGETPEEVSNNGTAQRGPVLPIVFIVIAVCVIGGVVLVMVKKKTNKDAIKSDKQ